MCCLWKVAVWTLCEDGTYCSRKGSNEASPSTPTATPRAFFRCACKDLTRRTKLRRNSGPPADRPNTRLLGQLVPVLPQLRQRALPPSPDTRVWNCCQFLFKQSKLLNNVIARSASKKRAGFWHCHFSPFSPFSVEVQIRPISLARCNLLAS